MQAGRRRSVFCQNKQLEFVTVISLHAYAGQVLHTRGALSTHINYQTADNEAKMTARVCREDVSVVVNAKR